MSLGNSPPQGQMRQAERLAKAVFIGQDHSQVSRRYHGRTEVHPAQPWHGGDLGGRGTGY